MPEVTPDALVRQLRGVLREALEGGGGAWTYFIDNRPDAGLLGALAAVDAREASRAVNGSTIAAQMHHVAFAIEVASARIEGDSSPCDWAESWRVTTLDERGWAELRERLGRAYARLRPALESQALSSEDAFGEAVGAIAHLAYHLGAIRQKIAGLRAEGALRSK